MSSVLTLLQQLTRRRRPAETAVDIHAPLLTATVLNELIARVLAVPALSHHARATLTPDSGDVRSVRLGRGIDFEESRLYQRGDDVRAMDWRTTARTGKPYLKIYREEHQPVLHVVIDRSAGMRFATRHQLKATQAARLAVLYSYAAVRANTCIGGTLWQPDEMNVACRTGEAGALSLVRAALTACPPLAKGSTETRSFTELCRALDTRLPSGARVVFLSDFARVAASDVPALRALAGRHEVSAMQILDAAECDLPDVGLMRFADLASGTAGWLDTHAAPVREEFRVASIMRHEHQRKIFERAGIALTRCMTHDDAFEIWMATP